MDTLAIFGEVLADIFPDKTVKGGAPYNVARHLAGLQQHALLITRLGNDALKDAFLTELSHLNMDTSGLQLDNTYPSGQVKVHIDNKTHRFEISADQAYDYIDADEAGRTVTKAKPSMLYFGSLAQRNATSRAALNQVLASTSCPRFLDINLRAPWYTKSILHDALMHADIVKLSDEELTTIAALWITEGHEEQDKARALMDQFALKTLYVTCGEKGAWALSSMGETSVAEPIPLNRQLVDTVGAGDAFSSICMLGALNHWPLDLTVSRASQFAAAVCKIRGASPEDNRFYQPFLSWIND